MPRKKKPAVKLTEVGMPGVLENSPITYSYCQEAPLYELAANAVNLLCAISNRQGHRIGDGPESCIERAIMAAAEVAVSVQKGHL